MKKIISQNPANNYEKLWEVTFSSDEEIQRKLLNCNNNEIFWKNNSIKNRIIYMKQIYNLFIINKDKIVKLLSLETWKSLDDSCFEFDFSNKYNKWFIENIEDIISEKVYYRWSYWYKIIYEPYWTTLIILPWNFPYLLFTWKFFSNLLVWNTIIIKPSKECVLITSLLQNIIDNSSLPKWIFNVVYGDRSIWNKLISHNIKMVSFTWSTENWLYINSLSSNYLIKTNLELWGSNPWIIFDDIDISDELIDKIVSRKFFNMWQSCDWIKKIIIHESLYDIFLYKLKLKLDKFVIWDPFLKWTTHWSLISKLKLSVAKKQLKKSLVQWAEIYYKYKLSNNLKGAYFPFIVLTNINSSMDIWNDEIFAPILPIIKFSNYYEAIKLANDSKYWMTAYIFTRNEVVKEKCFTDLDFGTIELNFWNHWIPEVPFWWFKLSWNTKENWEIWVKNLCKEKVICFKK